MGDHAAQLETPPKRRTIYSEVADTKYGNNTTIMKRKATAASCMVVISTFPGEGFSCPFNIARPFLAAHPTKALCDNTSVE